MHCSKEKLRYNKVEIKDRAIPSVQIVIKKNATQMVASNDL